MPANATGLALGLWLVSGPEPVPSIEVEWSAPAGCPSAEDVHAEAMARMQPSAGAVSVVGRVTESPDGRSWILALELRTASGSEERSFVAEACEELAAAAGFLVAGAANARPMASPPSQPTTELVEPLAPPRPTGPDRTAAVPTPSHPREPPAPQRQRRALDHASIRVEGLAQALHVLPRPIGGGLGAAAGVQRGRGRAELRGHYFFEQRVEHPQRPTIEGTFDLWVLGPSACWVPAVGRVELPLCGGAELGAMRGRGDGALVERRRASRLYAAAILDAALVYRPRPSLGLWLGARGVVVARRPGFYVNGLTQELFRTGPVGLRLVGGIELRFPRRERPRP